MQRNVAITPAGVRMYGLQTHNVPVGRGNSGFPCGTRSGEGGAGVVPSTLPASNDGDFAVWIMFRGGTSRGEALAGACRFSTAPVLLTRLSLLPCMENAKMQPYTLAGIGGYRCIDHSLALKCGKFISRTEAESYYAMTMVKTSRIQVFVEPLALNLASVD